MDSVTSYLLVIIIGKCFELVPLSKVLKGRGKIFHVMRFTCLNLSSDFEWNKVYIHALTRQVTSSRMRFTYLNSSIEFEWHGMLVHTCFYITTYITYNWPL